MAYQPHHRPRSGGDRHPPKMPAPREVAYFDGERLRPELLDADAEAQAKHLLGVKSAQLRRFYEDVLSIHHRLELDEDRAAGFEKLLPEFRMLKAKAAYANGRDRKIFPAEFLQFFVDHVHAVTSYQDFDAFRKHFEAVVAFHKFYNPKD